jgi:hypothetical protein
MVVLRPCGRPSACQFGLVGVQKPPRQSADYVGDDGSFVYFRLYGPAEPFFDKAFALPDFDRMPY